MLEGKAVSPEYKILCWNFHIEGPKYYNFGFHVIDACDEKNRPERNLSPPFLVLIYTHLYFPAVQTR
jgi:hypothetical protein